MADRPPNDELLAALDALVAALDENTKCNRLATRQAQAIKRLHKRGQSYRDIFARDEHSVIRRVTQENVERLLRAATRLRWAEARALHAEGVTMDKIAVLFGVTRQRISGLLREQHGDEDGVAES